MNLSQVFQICKNIVISDELWDKLFFLFQRWVDFVINLQEIIFLVYLVLQFLLLLNLLPSEFAHENYEVFPFYEVPPLSLDFHDLNDNETSSFGHFRHLRKILNHMGDLWLEFLETPLSESLNVLSYKWLEFLASYSDPCRKSQNLAFPNKFAEEHESPLNPYLSNQVKLSFLVLLERLVQKSI